MSLSAPDIFYKPWHDKFITQFQSRIHKVYIYCTFNIVMRCQYDHNILQLIVTCKTSFVKASGIPPEQLKNMHSFTFILIAHIS